VSALGREGLNLPGLSFQRLIQTDAPINLGNSGGPLCDIDGEVIGINVALAWGAESIGFAIPVNRAKDVIPQLIKNGKMVRGYLGVMIKDVDKMASALGLDDDAGAFVEDVSEGTPAADAGMKVYDVIRQLDGTKVKDATDLMERVSNHAPGETVKLEIWRDGKSMDLNVKLGERPTEIAAAKPGETAVMGITVTALTPEIAQQLRLDPGTAGVVVRSVDPGSPAEDAGISRGDVIIEIAREKVASVADFEKLMGEYAKPGAAILVRTLDSSGRAVTRVINVPEKD